LLQALLDASPDGIYFKDSESRFIRCSSSMARLFKVDSADELVGKTDFDFFSEEHARQAFEDEQQIMLTGQPILGKTEKETWSDGRLTWTLTNKMPLRDAKGEIIGTFGVSKDITRNVLNDEQIRSQAALLDITQEAIFVRDLSGRIIYWNEGACHLYGWSMAEVRGRTIAELNLIPDLGEADRAFGAVQEHNEWSGEMRHKNRTGRDLVVQSQWNLMRERDGTPKAILVVNNDITEKKGLETQLLRAQRLESIGTLASGLAHDLNNVLAPIMMSVQLLKEGVTDEDQLASLQTLEACSARGASIIRQVLMFARGVEGQRVPLNPKHLVQEMERIARETFPRSIEVHVRLSKEPCTLIGDATQIQQVLMNLCVNARDAMVQGGTLTVEMKKLQLDETAANIHPKARPGRYVVISVTDTGTGIPAELLDKIFDPFFTTKPLGQGTGLGLPTVLGIAESHGGFVLVESQPGQGTTFRVYLPAAAADNDHGGTDTRSTVLARGNGELVLVVDDEPAVRRFASAILNRYGYRTLTATEGREGLKIFVEQHGAVKLVVSDLMMPQLDGLGMLRELRRIQPDIKTITVTGLGEENRISEAKAAGADVVLNKPFTAEQLLTNVKQLLSLNN
jgi:PAS domain S-box-containing protein